MGGLTKHFCLRWAQMTLHNGLFHSSDKTKWTYNDIKKRSRFFNIVIPIGHIYTVYIQTKQRRRQSQRKRHLKIWLYFICTTSRFHQLVRLAFIGIFSGLCFFCYFFYFIAQFNNPSFRLLHLLSKIVKLMACWGLSLPFVFAFLSLLDYFDTFVIFLLLHTFFSTTFF